MAGEKPSTSGEPPKPSIREKSLGKNNILFAVTWVDELEDVMAKHLKFNPNKVKALSLGLMEKFYERNMVLILAHLDNDIKFAGKPYIIPDNANPGSYIWGIEKSARGDNEMLQYKQQRCESPFVYTYALLAIPNYDGEVPFMRRDDSAIAMHLREIREAEESPDDPEENSYFITRQTPTSGHYLH